MGRRGGLAPRRVLAPCTGPWTAKVGPGMEAGVFDSIGVTGPEERAYRLLLERPGCSLSEVSRSLALSSRMARTVLEGLERKGLATLSADRVPRFMPARPDVAMGVLILRRQEELARARLWDVAPPLGCLNPPGG